jgi:hypothetical protein
MERLTINIPDKKSALVKQILKGLGVTIQEKHPVGSAFKDKLVKVSTWTEEDLKSFDDAQKAFSGLKSAQW